MPSDGFRFPNVIPPRTSSTNSTAHASHHAQKSSLSSVPETNWLGPDKTKKGHSHSISTGAVGFDPSGHISDDMIFQKRSTWSDEKEKV